MLVEYAVAVVVAGLLYTMVVSWAKGGAPPDVLPSHIEDRATLIGLWLVPLCGAILLLLFYGLRFVWWQIS